MRLSIQYEGARFAIYAIELANGQCPTVEFLARLKQNDTASHKSLVHRYIRHAELGQSHNQQQSRAIAGRRNLFEFKSRRGDRLLYFYLPNGATVLIHGFRKGAPEQEEYDKAEALRDQYLAEVGYDDRPSR